MTSDKDQANYYKRAATLEVTVATSSEVSEIKGLITAIAEHNKALEEKLDRLTVITERLAMRKKLGMADYD